ncbi:MAG TPA: hypothetical protein VHK66_02255 [Microvirga sp.]|jgi:hypothetical protein|nr:hypothetical protein [Microvirga sp.]
MRLGRLMAAAAACLLAGAAWADEMPLNTVLEGLYQGSGEGALSLSLINLEGETFAALITTAVPGRCAGRLSGIGKLERTEMIVENVDSRDDAVCRLTIRFSRQGKRAQVTSAGQCTYFHGAACGFRGVLEQVVVPAKLRPKK